MKRKYDLVFGLGMVCSCSESLRHGKLQHLSFPGDWTAPVFGEPAHNLLTLVDETCAELKDAFRLEDFRFIRKIEENGKDAYANLRTKYVYNHDIPSGADLAVELPKVEAKYRRRLDRLLGLIRSSKRVLAVRIDPPGYPHPTTREDCDYALAALDRKFPGVRFEMILVQPDESRAFADPLVEAWGERVTRLACDYRDRRPGKPKWAVDILAMGRFLAARVSVRDYRTSAERRAHAQAEARRRWAKYGATTRGGYLLAKLKRLIGVK